MASGSEIFMFGGVPAKLVQEKLGHSSITMTLDLYSHVTPKMASWRQRV